LTHGFSTSVYVGGGIDFRVAEADLDADHAASSSLQYQRLALRPLLDLVAPSASPWLRGTAGNAGRVPGSVRAALDGQTFSSRADFRAAFWRAAGDDPALASQFSQSNVTLMQSGRAPIAPSSQHFGGRTRYELHHVTPVSRGGAEFDLNNIVVVTPRYHQDVLSTSYHYGGGG
jgi:hypothetical protein